MTLLHYLPPLRSTGVVLALALALALALPANAQPCIDEDAPDSPLAATAGTPSGVPSEASIWRDLSA